MKFHYPLVECIWLDAETSYGWEDISEADLSPALAITVGFLVAHNEHYIMIASTYSETTCNSRIKIPITMIEGLKELRTSASKKSLLPNLQSSKSPTPKEETSTEKPQEQPLTVQSDPLQSK